MNKELRVAAVCLLWCHAHASFLVLASDLVGGNEINVSLLGTCSSLLEKR